MSKKKLFLLDAYALIYRSYYAFIKNPRVNSKGQNTSAIFRFVDTLEEVTAETIRRPKITFYIGKELRQLLKDTPKVLGSLDMKGYKSRKSSGQENP